MSTIEVWWIGIALAMDCFAVSVSSGISARKIIPGLMLTAILAFGLFQGAMLLGGYGSVFYFSNYLTIVGRWISVALLGFLGGKMVWDDIHPNKNEEKPNILTYKNIPILAIATSIDAMAVGVSFTFLQDVDWNFMMYVFAVVAFSSSLLSALGMGIGVVVGKKLHFPTSFIGGVILISIAIKIVIEYFTEI